MTTLRLRLAPLALALTAAACGADTGDAAAAEGALDSTIASSSESALAVSVIESATAATTSEEAASTAAEAATTLFEPAGCLTTSVAGATTTYTFAGCTGPYGLVELTGVVTATYSVSRSGVSVTLAASDFAVNEGSIDIATTATYASLGASESITVESTSAGVGRYGRGFSRSGSTTATWTATCITLNGTYATTVDGDGWSTTIDGFEACTAACPNGSVTVAGARNTYDLAFDGTSTATWSVEGARNRTGTLALRCGE